jgi:hypothetical protein
MQVCSLQDNSACLTATKDDSAPTLLPRLTATPCRSSGRRAARLHFCRARGGVDPDYKNYDAFHVTAPHPRMSQQE